MRHGASRSFLAQGFADKRTLLPQHAAVSDPFIDDTPRRRVPPKSASFSIMSRREDTSPLLPDRSPEAMNLSRNRSPLPETSNRNTYRAAERGRKNLLPTSVSSSSMHPSFMPARGSMNRERASSTSSFTSRRSNTTPSELQQMTQSLRSRKRSGGSNWIGTSDDEAGSMPTFSSPTPTDNHRHLPFRSIKPTWSDTFGKIDKPMRKRDIAFCIARSTLTIKRVHVFQAIVTCLVTFFVWDSYQKALMTTEQLLIIKHEESMMMLHLKRLEEQSLNLHESIARLSDTTVGLQQQNPDNAHGGSESFDGEIIKLQAKQLRDMEDELDHEVKALQAKIQHSDRDSIVRTFGEGPVQIILDLAFPQEQMESSKISILLWYDTPHAAWTLIEQLNKGLWNDSTFSLDKNVAILLEAPHSETLKKLDFVEKGQKKHESWTVGLTETTQGGLGLFINLQDNTQYHKHDVCIGKVIDGFDALQRLTSVTRQNQIVRVRRATASHLTRRESAGLS